MRLEDFAIGQPFYKNYIDPDGMLLWAKWRCTDIGTRTVCAIRVDSAETSRWRDGECLGRRTYTEEEAEAAGLFRGPPYSTRERVFDEYSLPNCHKEPSDDL